MPRFNPISPAGASDANDLIFGDTTAESIDALDGSDVALAGAANDTMVWSNGDGPDRKNGGAGRDTVAVNGSDMLADVFTIARAGAGVDFARTDFGNFTLDNSRAEVLEINAGGGNDVITRGNTDDPIEGGQGHDSLIGGRGNDTIADFE